MARWKSALCRGGILLAPILPLLFTGCGEGEGWPWERNMFDSPGPQPQESALEPPDGTVPASREAVAALAGSTPAEEPGRGEALFDQYCAVCHGEDGRGRELPGDYVTPDLTDPDYREYYEDTDFYDLIVEGGMNMPNYREELNEHERWLVVGRLRELQVTDGE